MINDLPTVFEVVADRKQTKEKTNSDNSGSKSKPSGKVRSFFFFKFTKLTFSLLMFVS